MERLIRGLETFAKSIVPEKRDLLRRLASGQAPEVLLITCSDSRVVPELMMQAEPGDLFVLRNAGNLVPPYGASNGGESGTIEYAVAALGVKHIIVCGHTRCGAMAGLLSPASVESMPAVAEWLKQAATTERVVGALHPELEGEQRVDAAVKQNVLVQLDNLRGHPAVAAALRRGQVTLEGWVYEIESGRVLAWDEPSATFKPIVEGLARDAA